MRRELDGRCQKGGQTEGEHMGAIRIELPREIFNFKVIPDAVTDLNIESDDGYFEVSVTGDKIRLTVARPERPVFVAGDEGGMVLARFILGDLKVELHNLI